MGRPIVSRNTLDNPMDVEQQLAPQIHISDRIVYLSGDVNEHTISQIIAGILSLVNHDRKSSITLIVSTYGGAADEMFSLYDIIKYIPCPVHTVGLGKIMSAGVLLLSAGTKGTRLIGANARVMIHPIAGGIGGNIFEVQNEAKEYERQQQLMESLLLKETKITRTELTTLMHTGHDNYITAQQAIKLGIVDKIIGSDKK